MDDAERLARKLDEEQKERFRRYRGSREEFYNSYEQDIYFKILSLYKKSKTYQKEA